MKTGLLGRNIQRAWKPHAGPVRLLFHHSGGKLIFEVIHKRRKKSSTIFCSQFRDDGWYERLGGGDNPISDAIMDRIQYDAYRINIVPFDPANDRSMREVYGIKSTSDEK